MSMKPLLEMAAAEFVFDKTLGLYANRNIISRVCDWICFWISFTPLLEMVVIMSITESVSSWRLRRSLLLVKLQTLL